MLLPILLMSIFFNFTIESSELYKQLWAAAPEAIVTPYTPSLAVRYPKIAAWVVAALTHFSANAVAAKCNNSSTTTQTISVGAAGLIAYYVLQRRSIVDCVLTDPVYLLAFNRALHDEMISKIKAVTKEEEPKNSEKTLNIWRHLVAEYARKNPIYLLGECDTGKDFFGSCPMSRSLNFHYRYELEERVKSVFLIKNKCLQRSVNYVSFGSGGLLQDLIILAKILAEKPTMSVDVHLIDIKLVMLTVFLDHQKDDRMFMVNDDFNVDESTLKDCVMHVRKKCKGVFDKQTSDDQAMIDFKTHLYMEYENVKQLTSWLQKTFSEAQLSFFVHKKANEYVAYVEKKNLLSADIVVATDIEDEMSFLKGSTIDYVKLCVQVLKNNSTAINIWLSKTDNQTGACIRSISLSPIDDQKPIAIEGIDDFIYMNELIL